MSVLDAVDKRIQLLPAAVANNVQVVFVSVDPQRDELEELSTYVQHFNKRFLGVSGLESEVETFARQFAAGYMREEGQEGNYLISHTSSIFLTDPQKRLVAAFSQPHEALNITELFHMIRNLL